VSPNGDSVAVCFLRKTATQAFYQSVGQNPPAAGAAAPATLPPSVVQLLETVARHTSRTPAAPVAGSVPALPVGAGTPGAAPAEATLREQLATASQRLQTLLDQQWKQFLAMPAEVHQAGNPPDPEALRQALSRFDSVAQDPQFAALTQRPEFQAVHQQLRAYLDARTVEATSPLTLPPPPQPGNNPTGVPAPLFR
jgi:hypothetical protein